MNVAVTTIKRWLNTNVTSEGARFENLIASHLLKAVHFWNDRGIGDYALYFIRDKEKREVDFLVTKNQEPWFLVEANYSDNASISQHLYRFQAQLQAKYAFQVVFNAEYINVDCFCEKDRVIVPSSTFLSQLI